MGRTVTISFWAAFVLAHFYLGFRLYTWVLAPVCRFPLWAVALLMIFLGISFQIGHNARACPLWLRRFLIAVGGHWAGALLPLLIGFAGLDVLRLLFLLGGLIFPSHLLFYASLAVSYTHLDVYKRQAERDLESKGRAGNYGRFRLYCGNSILSGRLWFGAGADGQ